jgi:hypothetical protein
MQIRAGAIHVGAPGKPLIWRLFKPIFFERFRLKTGLAKIFEGASPNGYFRRNSFACGKLLSLPAPYFGLFQ